MQLSYARLDMPSVRVSLEYLVKQDTSGRSLQFISWLSSYGYLYRSMLASTSLCKNHPSREDRSLAEHKRHTHDFDSIQYIFICCTKLLAPASLILRLLIFVHMQMHMHNSM